MIELNIGLTLLQKIPIAPRASILALRITAGCTASTRTASG